MYTKINIIMQGLRRLLIVLIQDLLLIKNCHIQAALGEVTDRLSALPLSF